MLSPIRIKHLPRVVIVNLISLLDACRKPFWKGMSSMLFKIMRYEKHLAFQNVYLAVLSMLIETLKGSAKPLLDPTIKRYEIHCTVVHKNKLLAKHSSLLVLFQLWIFRSTRSHWHSLRNRFSFAFIAFRISVSFEPFRTSQFWLKKEVKKERLQKSKSNI